MSNKRFRQVTRYLHVTVGVMLIVFVYSPLGEVSWYTFLVQVVAVPLVTLSGIALWQQPKLSAWRKRRPS